MFRGLRASRGTGAGGLRDGTGDNIRKLNQPNSVRSPLNCINQTLLSPHSAHQSVRNTASGDNQPRNPRLGVDLGAEDEASCVCARREEHAPVVVLLVPEDDIDKATAEARVRTPRLVLSRSYEMYRVCRYNGSQLAIHAAILPRTCLQ